MLKSGCTQIKAFYDSPGVQNIVIFLISFNFLVTIVSLESPIEKGSTLDTTLNVIEWTLTIIFMAELLLNAVANWFWDFVSSPWNFLDSFVVVISVASLFMDSIENVSVLRLFRTIRVVRMMRRLESLRKIVNSLASSIGPVLSAFTILIMTTCLYASMAVILFGNPASLVEVPTDRDLANIDEFGKFTDAMFTMLQVSTGDGWVTAIVRPKLDGTYANDAGAILFFTSYYILVSLIVMNIVVAILLDEFVTNVQAEDQQRAENKRIEALNGPLDPLLEALTSFRTRGELNKQIHNLYSPSSRRVEYTVLRLTSAITGWRCACKSRTRTRAARTASLPPPLPRTNRTSLVPPLVLSGHAASLTPS